MKDLCFGVIDVHKAVENENKHQLDKWGVQDHSPFEWLAFTTEELGELANAISEHYYRDGDRQDVAKEAIQVATLALKIAEMYRHGMDVPTQTTDMVGRD